MTTTPPLWLLEDFDPAKAKVAELRGILLENDVPYSSNAKKPELVAAFEKQVRPRIPALLAELSTVRASDQGILDGESQDGSLKELDTDSDSAAEAKARAERAKSKKSKVQSKARKSLAAGKRKGKGRAESEVDELASEDLTAHAPREVGKKAKPRKSVRLTSPRVEEAKEEDAMEVDELASEDLMAYAPREVGKKAKPRKSVRLTSPRVEEAKEEDAMEVDELAVSPRKRKTVSDAETPRSAAALKNRRQTLQCESGGEAGFSDYNPFQSGGEETPKREVKRRKSSLGPARLREKKSGIFDGTPGRKSMPPLPVRPDLAGTWASTPEPAPAGPSNQTSPAVPPLPTGTSVTSSSKTTSASAGTPIGVKYMVPVQKVKRSPPGAAALFEAYEQLEHTEHAEDAELEYDAQRPEHAEEFESKSEYEFEDATAARSPLSFSETQEPYEEEQEPGEQEVQVQEPSTPVEVHRRTPAKASALKTTERHITPRHSEPARYAPSPRQAFAQTSVAPRHFDPVQYAPSPRQAFPQVSTPRRSLPASSSPATRQVAGFGRTFASEPDNAIIVRSARSNNADAARRVSTWTLVSLFIAYLLWWREEKLAAGFCDSGSLTNSRISSRSTSLSLPLVSLPAPALSALDSVHFRPTCTPCPAHGYCSEGAFVGCSGDHVLRQSPLRLGGLLPVPPTCVPDTEKLMMVATQASKASKMLRQRRGEVVCQGLEKLRRKQAPDGADEAWIFGISADKLLTALRNENEMSGKPYADDVLEEVNRLALNDLITHGEVIIWQAGDEYWYASKRAEMPLSCQARLAAIRSAKRHKTSIGGLLSAIFSVFWLRMKLNVRRQEKVRVAALVQTALSQLQRQERSHHADPVLVPFAHIAPLHLRDLILQDVHSPARRAQLWKKVEKVIEGNSNVRVINVEQNGEELRGWLWTGSTRAIEDVGSNGRGEKPAMVQRGKGVLG
ncbi:hypothetical protein JCM1841_006329 [Sporobolomyces salmonicolor]